MYNNVNYNKVSFPDKNIKIVVLDENIFPPCSDLNFKLLTFFFFSPPFTYGFHGGCSHLYHTHGSGKNMKNHLWSIFSVMTRSGAHYVSSHIKSDPFSSVSQS